MVWNKFKEKENEKKIGNIEESAIIPKSQLWALNIHKKKKK